MHIRSFNTEEEYTQSNSDIGTALIILFKVQIVTTDSHGYIDFSYTGDQVTVLTESNDEVPIIESILPIFGIFIVTIVLFHLYLYLFIRLCFFRNIDIQEPIIIRCCYIIEVQF